jgi:hypothetical protein
VDCVFSCFFPCLCYVLGTNGGKLEAPWRTTLCFQIILTLTRFLQPPALKWMFLAISWLDDVLIRLNKSTDIPAVSVGPPLSRRSLWSPPPIPQDSAGSPAWLALTTQETTEPWIKGSDPPRDQKCG